MKIPKNKYVLKHKSVDIFLKDLTVDVNRDRNTEMSNMEVSRLMKEIGITGKTSTGNHLRFKIDHEVLDGIFRKNHWIHETDEYEGDSDEEQVELSFFPRHPTNHI